MNENRVTDHTLPFGRNQIFEPDDNSQTKVEASAQDLPATRQDPPAGPTQHQHGGLGKTHPGNLSNPTFITFITLPFKLGKVIKRFDSNLFLCYSRGTSSHPKTRNRRRVRMVPAPDSTHTHSRDFSHNPSGCFQTPAAVAAAAAEVKQIHAY